MDINNMSEEFLKIKFWTGLFSHFASGSNSFVTPPPPSPLPPWPKKAIAIRDVEENDWSIHSRRRMRAI